MLYFDLKDVEDVDMNARSQMLATMQSVSKEDLLVMAAGAGDATTVRQCLRQHPEQVSPCFSVVSVCAMPVHVVCEF